MLLTLAPGPDSNTSESKGKIISVMTEPGQMTERNVDASEEEPRYEVSAFSSQVQESVVDDTSDREPQHRKEIGHQGGQHPRRGIDAFLVGWMVLGCRLGHLCNVVGDMRRNLSSL